MLMFFLAMLATFILFRILKRVLGLP